MSRLFFSMRGNFRLTAQAKSEELDKLRHIDNIIAEAALPRHNLHTETLPIPFHSSETPSQMIYHEFAKLRAWNQTSTVSKKSTLLFVRNRSWPVGAAMRGRDSPPASAARTTTEGDWWASPVTMRMLLRGSLDRDSLLEAGRSDVGSCVVALYASRKILDGEALFPMRCLTCSSVFSAQLGVEKTKSAIEGLD